MKISHYLLNGVKTYAFSSRNDLIQYVSDQKKILVAVNAEKILHADQQLSKLINSNIGYADGEGAIWALKSHGLKDVVKIPGCELWLDIIRSLYNERSFYLVGAREEVINKAVKKLKSEFQGINILNYRDGYIKSEKDKIDLITDLCIKKPDIVFVAAGSPRQEILMSELLSYHPALYMGLGGSFDVYTGVVNRAPKFFIKNHLEWFYRLIKEPSRIGRQIQLIRFAYLLLFKAI